MHNGLWNHMKMIVKQSGHRRANAQWHVKLHVHKNALLDFGFPFNLDHHKDLFVKYYNLLKTWTAENLFFIFLQFRSLLLQKWRKIICNFSNHLKSRTKPYIAVKAVRLPYVFSKPQKSRTYGPKPYKWQHWYMKWFFIYLSGKRSPVSLRKKCGFVNFQLHDTQNPWFSTRTLAASFFLHEIQNAKWRKTKNIAFSIWRKPFLLLRVKNWHFSNSKERKVRDEKDQNCVFATLEKAHQD